MIPLEKIEEEVDKLIDKFHNLFWESDIFDLWSYPPSIVSFGDWEMWDNVSSRFEIVYRSALQLMETTGYVGAKDFARLYEDEKFSMQEFFIKYFIMRNFPGGPNENELCIFFKRIHQMYGILLAFPDAIKAISETEPKNEKERILYYFSNAIKFFENKSYEEGAAYGRLAIVKALKLICKEKNINVDNRRYLRVDDYTEALMKAEEIKRKEKETIDGTYKACNGFYYGKGRIATSDKTLSYLKQTKEIVEKLL